LTSSLEKPLLSIARAAQTIESPCWVLDLLIDLGALSVHRVEGVRRVRHREIDALRRRRDPSYRHRSEARNGNG
jgi:hypothetical protein